MAGDVRGDEEQSDIIEQPKEQNKVADSKKQDNKNNNQNKQQITKERSNDLLGDLATAVGHMLVVMCAVVMDCFELTFANMSYASGKHFKYVLLIVASYTPISIISVLLGYVPCVLWQDALLALLVTAVLYAVNGINDVVIKNSVTKMQAVSRRLMEGAKTKHGKASK